MEMTRSGFILYVKKYKECIKFYTEDLGLKIMFESEELTCYAFGGSYLMVEQEDDEEYLALEDGVMKTFTCLRLNVPDVKHYAKLLTEKGIEVNYMEFDWGTIAKFYDPDGNLLAFKDDKTFEDQIANYKP